MGERHCLEQAAHAVGLGEALGGLDQRAGLGGRLSPGKDAGALEQAEGGQKRALRDRAVHGGAGGAGGGGEAGEIDMGSEVARAGVEQRVGRAAFVQGLQGGMAARRDGAVIEDQGGAALVRQTGRELLG